MKLQLLLKHTNSTGMKISITIESFYSFAYNHLRKYNTPKSDAAEITTTMKYCGRVNAERSFFIVHAFG
jgi:hypothetical protein